jgi:hypothetical protein
MDSRALLEEVASALGRLEPNAEATSQDIRCASLDRRPRKKDRTLRRSSAPPVPNLFVAGPSTENRQEILMKRIATWSAAAFAVLASTTSAQHGHLFGHHDRGHSLARTPDVTIAGFQLTGSQPIGLYDAYATLSSGERVDFDGDDVNLTADDGTVLAQLGNVPEFVFPSFVRIDPTETFALVGESSNGDIFKVDLGGAGMSTLTNLGFNFDAVFEDAGHAFVSAAPCGFFCGSEIDRVDLVTGAQTKVATLVAPSGPLARASNGDIYYAVQPLAYPPPDDTWSIIRWTDAQLTSGTVQNEASATTFVAGLNGGSSIAIDAVYGHLFVAEAFFGGGGRLREFNTSGQSVETVISSDNYLSNLEFLYGSDAGSFQAFQPANGVTLKFRSTDFSGAGSSLIHTNRPVRPIATISGPGLTGPGSVTLEVTGGVPEGTIHFVSCPAGVYNPTESGHDLGNFLFVTGMPVGMIHHVATVPANLAGAGSYTLTNPGNQQGTLVFQALVADTPGHYIGSSTAVFN